MNITFCGYENIVYDIISLNIHPTNKYLNAVNDKTTLNFNNSFQVKLRLFQNLYVFSSSPMFTQEMKFLQIGSLPEISAYCDTIDLIFTLRFKENKT